MMHLDFEVSDLEEAVVHALELGAQEAEHQPQTNVGCSLTPPVTHSFSTWTRRNEARTPYAAGSLHVVRSELAVDQPHDLGPPVVEAHLRLAGPQVGYRLLAGRLAAQGDLRDVCARLVVG